MDSVARRADSEREELFREVAAQMAVNPVIVEKDFWVCWVLEKLFSDDELKDHLVFKGGTSLSKVYGLIERFSEDIDLILDWRLLGYGPGQKDPFVRQPSKTKQRLFSDDFNRAAIAHIEGHLLPHLKNILGGVSGVVAAIAEDDAQTINISYPTCFARSYLRPQVCLEIGPLAAWIPSATHTVRSFAAEHFPDVFEKGEFRVVAISAERTFWEKPLSCMPRRTKMDCLHRDMPGTTTICTG